jgi:hypothetical protein
MFGVSPGVEEAVSKLSLPAPTARSVKAWAIGPGTSEPSLGALKARNVTKAALMLNSFGYRVAMSRFQRLGTCAHSPQGVALGYHMSRLWRWEHEFRHRL